MTSKQMATISLAILEAFEKDHVFMYKYELELSKVRNKGHEEQFRILLDMVKKEVG